MKLCEFKDELIKKKIDEKLNASNEWKVVNKNKKDPPSTISNSSKSTLQSSCKNVDYVYNNNCNNNSYNLNNQNSSGGP